MAASVLRNRAGVVTATAGNGTVTLGAAIAAAVSPFACSWLTFANAGVSNGDVVRYLILDTNGAWEYGTGTYTTAGTTLTRVLGASSTGALLVLSGTAQVFIAAVQEDVVQSSSASATDNTLCRFDSTTGKIIQSTGITVDDTDILSSALRIRVNSATDPSVASAESQVYVSCNGNTDWGITNVSVGAHAAGASWVMGKTRGATAATNTTVVTGDRLGSFTVYGNDGTQYVGGAQLVATCEGTISAGVMPTVWRAKWVDGAGALKDSWLPRSAVLASDATTNSTTTGVEITGLQVTGLAAGTYVFQYYIVYQAAATTTGVRFGVNHTGTVTFLVANMRYQESTTAASTGAASQAAAGGTLHAGASCRAISTTTPNLSLTTGVDTLNANMLMIIEGVIQITGAGDFELWHASEVAAASTVKAQSSVIIQRVA